MQRVYKGKMVWEIYRDKAGRYRWRSRNFENNKILAVSSQGYKRRADAVHCARLHGYGG